MRVQTFRYQPGDVYCKLCTEYRGKRNPCLACPWLRERMEAGVMNYGKAVRETFPPGPYWNWEYLTRPVIESFPGTLFMRESHRKRMEWIKSHEDFRSQRTSPAYFAALYLLTSVKELHNRCVHCFCRDGILFQRAALRGLSPREEALFYAAKYIFKGQKLIVLHILRTLDAEDTEAVALIVNAMLILRYGTAALEIQETAKRIDASPSA